MELDFSALRRALDRLHEARQQVADQPEHELLRDGLIQRFEFSFDLAIKLLRRHLEATEPVAESVRELSFAGLIRLADARGLLRGGLDSWQQFRTARNTSSHAYDALLAQRVLEQISVFADEAEYLYQQLIESR
jgi:nucleotidyltransferase substrate binding protein (TIGR01987 family)